MEFEDFVISGIVIGDTIEKATSKVDKNSLQNAELGKYILEAVKETDKWIAQQYKSWNRNDDYSNSLVQLSVMIFLNLEKTQLN